MQGLSSRSISLYVRLRMKSTGVSAISSVAQVWQYFALGQTSPHSDGHRWPQDRTLSHRREHGVWSHGAAQGMVQAL